MLATLLPIGAAAMMFGLRDLITPTAAALVLVLLVVGSAATGDRVAGLLSCLAGAAGFDFFLTTPYLDFHVENRGDLELAVLLLLVGLAVSELALWGGRQRSAASDRAGYLDGIRDIADLAAGGASQQETVEAISRHILRTLRVEKVMFVEGSPGPEVAVLGRDGTLTAGGIVLDPKRDGLPTDRFTAIPVVRTGQLIGYFQVSAAATQVRVKPEQVDVVVLLADQLAARASLAA
ncbi:MAG: DUF4118 domain-containing protein [Propionicimonas sp.]